MVSGANIRLKAKLDHDELQCGMGAAYVVDVSSPF